jgi:NitT/TauT family transport system permease protein
MRLALANAFLVIVAAEALGTRSGIGYLIWNSRTYFRTDHIFVGIVCLGALGFTFDRTWRLVGRTILQRFLRREGNY